MSPFSCAQVRDVAEELGLGLIDAEVRAAALVHLQGCATCRPLVEEMARVADLLLLLAPEAEPPIGFEDRVLASVDAFPASGGGAGGRARPWVAVAAAIVIAAGAGAAIGASLGAGDDAPVAAPSQSALLHTMDGRTAGFIDIDDGDVTIVTVGLDYPEARGGYTVELVRGDGTRRAFGGLVAVGGKASKVWRVRESLRGVRRVDVKDERGITRCSSTIA